VTGQLRGIGQNVLQSSLDTGFSNSLTYDRILFLITFQDEEWIINITQ